MKSQIFRMTFVTSLALGGVLKASADYDVLASFDGGGRIGRYSVSDDGLNWTEQPDFLASGAKDTYAAPGDGWVYIPVGNRIVRYKVADPTVSEDFKTGLPFSFSRLALSPDKAWLYAVDAWAGAVPSRVYRYRLSDGVGGSAGLSGTAARIRGMAFGPDGTLYLGARGNNAADTTPSSAGVHVYDVQSYFADTQKFGSYLGRYHHAMTTAGTGVLLDKAGTRLYSTVNSTLRMYAVGQMDEPESTVNFPKSGNYLATLRLGDNLFFGDYANGYVYRLDASGTLTLAATLGTKLCGFTDITGAADNGSRLMNLTHHYAMEDGDDRLNNAISPYRFNVYKGTAVFREPGASGKGVKVANSGMMMISSDGVRTLPETGDFTFSIWAYVGSRQRGSRGTLFSTGLTHIGVDADGRLQLSRLPSGAVDEESFTGTRSVLGGWHSLVVEREGGAVRFYVDNVLDGEFAVAADIPFETDAACLQNGPRYLKIGSRADDSAALKGAYLDEFRMYNAALTAEDRTHLYDLVHDALREEWTHDDAQAEALGRVVAWELGVNADVSPSVVEFAGRTFVSVGGKVRASEDGFTTAVDYAGPGLEDASLFTDGERLGAVGRNPGGKLAVATSGDGVNWSMTELGSGIDASAFTVTRPVFRNGSLYVAMPSAESSSVTAVVVTVPIAGGVPGTPSVAELALPAVTPVNSFKNTHARYNSVTLLDDRDGNIRLIGSSARVHAARGEALILANVSAGGVPSYDLALSFPGGSKPLSVIFDPASGRYWAVASGYHYRDRVASVRPEARSPALALYSSEDLYDWSFHGDVIAPEDEAYLSNPSLSIDGSTLRIFFAAGFASVGEASDVTARNYAIVHEVANFRAIKPTSGTFQHQQRFLVCFDYEDAVMSFCEESSTGDWLPAGVFARGTYDGKSLLCPINVCTFGGSVFVACKKGGLVKPTAQGMVEGIFEFDRRGTFRRYYPLEGYSVDGFCATGTKIYVSGWFNDKLYIIDRATGGMQTKTVSGMSVCRGVAVLPNGDVALSSRNNGSIYIVDGETGSTKATLSSLITCGKEGVTGGSGPWTLACDPADGSLLVAVASSTIRRLAPDCSNYANATGTDLVVGGFCGNIYGLVPAADGSIFATTFSYGAVQRIVRSEDGAWTRTEVDPIGGSYEIARGCFIEQPRKGVVLILK